MNINHKNIYHLQLKTYTKINPKHIDYLFTTLWYEMLFHAELKVLMVSFLCISRGISFHSRRFKKGNSLPD